MAKNNQKMVEEITAMDVDFAKWYTDAFCKKGRAGLHQRQRMHGHPSLWLRHLGKAFSAFWTACSRRPAT